MIYFGVGENNYAYDFGFVFIVIAMLYILQKMRAREKKGKRAQTRAQIHLIYQHVEFRFVWQTMAVLCWSI